MNAMAGEGADLCDFSRCFQLLKLQHARLYAVLATEVLGLKALKVNKCGTARRSVMIGGLHCVYCFIRFSGLERTFLKQHFFPSAKRTPAIAVAITAPAIP